MRPISLRMEGFSSFLAVTELDFEDITFFGLVGPTGSGKSSVLDAIVFACYGQVPRYDSMAGLPHIVNPSSVEARVSFVFEVNTTRVRVTRILKRSDDGTLRTREARFEILNVDGTVKEIPAANPTQVTKHVEAILGLTYEHFCRSVIFPQGEFARFLHVNATGRRAVMADLLGVARYETAGKAANGRSRSAGVTVKEYQARLNAELADMTPERLTASESAHAETLRQVASSEALLLEHAELTAQLHELVAARYEHERDLATWVAPPVVMIPNPELVIKRTEVTAELSELATRIKRLETETVEPPVLQSLERLRVQLESLESVWNTEDSDLGASQVEAAEIAHRQAVDQVAATRTLIEETDRADMVSAIRSGLHSGDTCPVCTNVYPDGPMVSVNLDASMLRSQLKDHEALLTKTQQACTAAKLSAAKLEETARRNKETLTKVLGGLDALAGKLPVWASDMLTCDIPDLLNACTDLIVEANTKTGSVTSANRALLTVTQTLAEVNAQIDTDDRNVTESETRYETWKRNLPADPPKNTDLIVWVTTKHAETLTKISATDSALRTVEESIDKVIAELQHMAEGTVDWKKLPLKLAALEAERRTEKERLQVGVATVTEVNAAVEAAQTEMGIYRQVADLLGARGFIGWLVEDALVQLTAAAGEFLLSMTNGRYQLKTGSDGEFIVEDVTNSTDRPARSLSGGETFLASLALGLALGDYLAGLSGAASLDTLLIDEGFGTLDPETLDSVLGVLATMSTAGRTVGVITHIPEVADRVPTLFRAGEPAGTLRKVR